MTIPLKIIYSVAKGEFDNAMRDFVNPIAFAATGAIKDAGQQLKTRGRARIAAAGFSSRWQNAFRVNVYPRRGNSIDAAMFAYHKIPYAGVFERGAIIGAKGGRYLWLPLPNAPKRIGGRHLTPRLFIDLIGPLHFVNVPGKAPMLAAYMTSSAAAASGITVRKLKTGFKRLSTNGILSVVSVPIFYGINTVTIGAKFELGELFTQTQRDVRQYYVQNIKTGGK